MSLCFSNPNSGSGCCSSMPLCRMSSQPLAPTNIASCSASMDGGARHSLISVECTIHCMTHIPLCRQRIVLPSATSNSSHTSSMNACNIFASKHVWRTSLPVSMTRKSKMLSLDHSSMEKKSLISRMTNKHQTTQQRWQNINKATLLQLLKKCHSNHHCLLASSIL